MNTLEAGIIRRHTIVLQAGDGLHALLRHILLRQHNSQLLGTVVTVVEEDNHVTLLDGTVHLAIVDRQDELVCYTLVIAVLHGSHHILSLLALGAYQQVIGSLHTFPTLVTVHGIETAYNAGNGGITHLGALGCNLLNETLTALGVGITTVHKAVYKGILYVVFLTNLNQFEQMIQ